MRLLTKSCFSSGNCMRHRVVTHGRSEDDVLSAIVSEFGRLCEINRVLFILPRVEQGRE